MKEEKGLFLFDNDLVQVLNSPRLTDYYMQYHVWHGRAGSTFASKMYTA